MLRFDGVHVFTEHAGLIVNVSHKTRDAGHHNQLFFAESEGGEGSPNGFEAPPRPPEGGFDVRFSSNSFLALARTPGERTFPIEIQSVHYPLTIEWCIADGVRGSRWELRNGTSNIPLNADGKIRLEQISHLVLHMNAGSELHRPLSFGLEQNYPNPFNPVTVIRYQLPASSHVTISVYNVCGQEVVRLVDGQQDAGYREVEWDAGSLASGVYYYRVRAEGASVRTTTFSTTKKMLLLR